MSTKTVKTVATLLGDGTRNYPWFIRGHRSHEFTSTRELLPFCDQQGIYLLNVAHSGRSYERRDDGWYVICSTESCRKIHGVPPEGRKINA